MTPKVAMSEAREEKIEALVRMLYGLGGVRRELLSHALPELGGQGFSALAAIYRRAPARASDIAHALGVDLSVVSRQVRVLLEAGYVEREPDPEDGRALLLSLTPQGMDALRASHRSMVAASAEVLSDWDEEEIESLTANLTKLREAFFPEPKKTLAVAAETAR
jgi:DNA-binding MarR family transcriptional regulator